MLVSVAQVLSALELALVIGGDTRGGGVQMIRVDPMMFLQNRGVFGSDVLLHFRNVCSYRELYRGNESFTSMVELMI